MKKKAKPKPRGLTQDLLKKVDPYVYAAWRSENPQGKQMTKEDFVRISSEFHRQNWPEDYRDLAPPATMRRASGTKGRNHRA
jgi:hypothetical protein